MKKRLTHEQEAKRDERRARFKTLWKQVADMPELERVEMSNKLGLVTCEGHALSLCNTMLIALQLPGASVLGGFRQWLKHGRAVRKGEHGAMIWVPIGNGKTATPENPQPASNGEHDETRAHGGEGMTEDERWALLSDADAEARAVLAETEEKP